MLPNHLHPLYIAVSGSRSRGLSFNQSDVDRGRASKVSDIDYRGVYTAPHEVYWSPDGVPEFYKTADMDGFFNEARRWYGLVHQRDAKTFPSTEEHELLWVDKAFVVHSTPIFDFLREQRTKLLTKGIARRLYFAGRDQLEGGRKRLASADGDANRVREANKQISDAIRRYNAALVMLTEQRFMVWHEGKLRDFLLDIRSGHYNPHDPEFLRKVALLQDKCEQAFDKSDLQELPNPEIMNFYLKSVGELSRSLKL